MLLKAIELVPGAKALIAGDGPDLEYIRKLADGRKDVILLGRYDYTEIANIYACVDCIFAVYDADLPNVKIAFPNRLYEAIQCGLPLIVAKGTKLAELVENLGIGFAVDHASFEEIKEILIKLMNREIREKITKKCEAIKENYTWEHVEKEFITRFQGIINT